MRKIIAAFIFLLTFPAYAETNKTEPSTKIESLGLKAGTVRIMSTLEIGKVSGFLGAGIVSIEAIELYLPETKTKTLALSIETSKDEQTGTSFVDIDEINSLLKAIDYMTKELGNGAKFKKFTATYNTKSEFTISVFNGRSESSKISIAITSGNVMLFGEDISTLQKLRSLINTANAALTAK